MEHINRTEVSSTSYQYTTTEIEQVETELVSEQKEQAENLRRLATVLSRRASNAAQVSGAGEVGPFSFFDEHDPSLEPSSSDFDAAKWIQAFINQAEAEGIRIARTGVMYKDLGVSGTGDEIQLQQTVGSFFTAPLRPAELFRAGKKAPKRILQQFDGLVRSGELLIVLGRPGSGCSTLLKTICGELHGLSIDSQSVINYNGIPQLQMKKEFKGEVIYNQEVDKHFPHLTVGQTVEFAAAARTPQTRVRGISRNEFSKLMAQVVLAVCGLTHTYNTKVGNDFVRGVSGGERKRVSIAEMMLTGSPFGAWDNSTRGLDAATAFNFVRTLRHTADLGGAAHAVAIYQASQAIYDLFDKATVLYEGRQIYFGPAREAKAFFERQGWYCPPRQTTGDFLTSITNPTERQAREEMENKVPRTPEDFEKHWKASPEYAALLREMEAYSREFSGEPGDNTAEETKHAQSQALQEFRASKKHRQAKHTRPGSPYTISIGMQIRLNTIRAYQRIWGDKSSTVVNAGMQLVIALIIGSIFYQPSSNDATAGFYSKGAALFIAVLANALASLSEINNQYAQRPIVEKHASYAFYHPATEAFAGIVADIPVKFAIAVVFNLVLYFMAGLRREANHFFLFFLITYLSTFVMGTIFRTIAAATRTVSQAMTFAGIMILALTIYTGFQIAVPQMHVWFSWIRWINPLFYAFEILVANEFHGREFICSSIIPPYTPLQGESWICNAVGAVAGRATVNGDSYIAESYEYYWSHAWRNLGILFGFLIFFLALYMVTTELNSVSTSAAEYLIFQRGRVPAYLDNEKKGGSASNEFEKPTVAARRLSGNVMQDTKVEVGVMAPQKDIFTWRDVVYDIEIKGEPRRLLDHVSGWVKPGTLTTLMGVSGAGKTTLLDVLAQRTTVGVITGDMFVNGKPLDSSFQRKTGYVQQQDLHLETASVRESLRFSAMLRQPSSVSKEEKYRFVEEVIQMLNMGDFADAIVGVPGEGLNVEQRKLLTIGVELAAKPKLLLFLDEPTSGLDSQSSWAIVAFLRKLADAGQAVLCTIHQPSAVLFQQFDRLLFLAKGGKTVYFGDIGTNSRQLLDYFESRGARRCGAEENPAEYMLEIANGTSGQNQDWHTVWTTSPERLEVEAEIERLHQERSQQLLQSGAAGEDHAEFAMPFYQQLSSVTIRVFQQYWRMPSYIFSKFTLGIAAGLFIGFSFYRGGGTIAGMQNVLFSVFQLVTLFSTIVQQIQPLFVTQRALYEVRERPSKAYSWKAFMIANVIVEIPFQIITGVLIWACFYYPVVGAGQDSERQGLVLILCILLFIYASSFAQMTIAALPDATTAGAIVTLLMLMSLMFCGVLQTPAALPGFWKFMYYLSPFTYWISGMVSTMLHGRLVECSEAETSILNPPLGQSCGQYFAPFMEGAGAFGKLQNPNDTTACRYCSVMTADTYLGGSGIFWEDRWRNYGIVWAYVLFNILIAIGTYYFFRVRTVQRTSKRVGSRTAKNP
ncbi:ABC-2 type transporter [Thozetella sp. PMI_491]|nr:ABC-2 type transporter [Thozetella sp. PMI_491]